MNLDKKIEGLDLGESKSFKIDLADQLDDTIPFGVRQELFRKFTPKKIHSLKIAQAYDRLGYESKSCRVDACGNLLEFVGSFNRDDLSTSVFKLHRANFCKDRLCPTCQWRKELKLFATMAQICSKIDFSKISFLMLTLTVPNVPGEKLSGEITHLINSFQDFSRKDPDFKKISLGCFRSLEITYNHVRKDFHPHLHILIAVPVSYFKSRDYKPQSWWLERWKHFAKDDSITQVDIRRVYSRDVNDKIDPHGVYHAICEVVKYSVKPSDFPDEAIRYLVIALHKRRLISFSGIFKKIAADLNLELDLEKADLVHITDDPLPDLDSRAIFTFIWDRVLGCYSLRPFAIFS